MADDLSGGAAAASAGLSRLGNFLQGLAEWRVKKPQIQAQTAQLQQQTDQNKQLFDQATLPQAVQNLNQQDQTFQQVTLPRGKQDLSQAGQTFNDITLPQGKLALTGQQRQNDLQEQQLHLTKPAPDVSDQFTDPNVTAPDGTPAPPRVQMPYDEAVEKGYAAPDAQNHGDTWTAPYDHSTPFMRQPKAVQDAMVQRVIASNPVPHIPINEADARAALAGQSYRSETAMLPPINPYRMPGGLSIVSGELGPNGNTFKIARPGATRIPGDNGAPSGFSQVNGEIKEDPLKLAPGDVTERQNTVSSLQRSKSEVQEIRSLLAKTPSLVGRGIISGGSAIPKAIRSAGSYVGASPSFPGQDRLQKFLSSSLTPILEEVHAGSHPALYKSLSENIPTQDSTKQAWDDYLNRLENATDQSIEYQSQTLGANGAPITQFRGTLPPVSKASRVAPPQTSRVGSSEVPGSTELPSGVPKTVDTAEDYAKLPKGAKFTSSKYPDKVLVKP